MVKHLKLGQNYEDFEIKKLLVTILTNLSQDTSVVPVSKLLFSNILNRFRFITLFFRSGKRVIDLF